MTSIWFKPYSLADLDQVRSNTLMEHLDITFPEIGPDYVMGRMPVTSKVHQVYGVLHGGASVVLAETLGSLGAFMTIDDSKQFCVGQEINANHLRSVSQGVLIGVARPFHMGATSHVWGIDIRSDDDKLICVSRITVAIRDRKS
jgi:1,4-dihydroxy-2-naphthoyl-CoA hydrolase